MKTDGVGRGRTVHSCLPDWRNLRLHAGALAHVEAAPGKARRRGPHASDECWCDGSDVDHDGGTKIRGSAPVPGGEEDTGDAAHTCLSGSRA